MRFPKIAVIVLAVLRHDQRPADMAGGNNVSESTVRRWRDELIALLAAQAPRLDLALKKGAGFAFGAAGQASASGEPRHGAFDGPGVSAEPLAGVDSLAGDSWCDAAAS